MMRTFIFLMCTTVFCFNTENTFSQETVIIEKDQLVEVDQVFKIIKKQTELNFIYPKGLFKNTPKIQLKKGEIQASKLIADVLEKSHFNFKLTENNTIIINKVKAVEKITIQENVISGSVLEETGQPLPGVNIIVEGTSTGTQSDFDGNYSIKAKKGDVLIFSYVGFQSQKITVSEANTINLVLKEEASALDEVVVIGYGTQKKSNLTAAIATVDTKELENRPVNSITDMLGASVPGLNINVGSSAVTDNPSINLRGFTGLNSSGSPLIIVDGVPLDNPDDIKYVNPNDVDNISILKDASATAIYGSRAPNGAILITTKSGKKGQKMAIEYSSDIRISSPIGLPNSMKGSDYAIWRNNRTENSRIARTYTQETIDRILQYEAGEINTVGIIEPNGKYGSVFTFNASENHLQEAFRDNVFNQTHNLSLSGGSDNTTYFASFNALDAQGNYQSDIDWMKRYVSNIRVNTDIKPWLNVGLNSKYSRQESTRPTISTSGQNDNTFFDNLGFIPTAPAYYDNGTPNEFSIRPNLDGSSGQYENTTDIITTQVTMQLKPVVGLTVNADYTWRVKNSFDKNVELQFGGLDADGTPLPSRRSPRLSTITENSRGWTYHTANFNMNYETSFGKHNINVLAGYNEEVNNYRALTGKNSDFYTTAVQALQTTYGNNVEATDAFNSWAVQGYYGRLHYDYQEKYLIDFSGRYDASSRFAPDSRWAFFPSVAVGYNVAKEDFWPLNDVNHFKFTVQYGESGNQGDASLYSYLPTLGTTNQITTPINGILPPAVTIPPIFADDNTWAKPQNIGFGLEVGMFKNRLTADYNWYQRTVYDQIGPAVQLPEVLGTAPPVQNNSVTETRGWEFNINWRDQFNIKGSPLSYGIRAGISDYIGYVIDYVDNDTGTRNGWTPGQLFGELYGVKSAGIAQNSDQVLQNVLPTTGFYYPGDLFFNDTNGDGLINLNGTGNYWYSEGDRERLGFNYPRYQYNIAMNANWKGFTLSVLFQGVGHQKVYWANKFNFGTFNFMSAEQLERGWWTSDNPDAFYPRAYNYNLNQLRENTVNDQYVNNLAHLRVKNVGLTYNFSEDLISKLRVSKLSITLSGENLGFVFNKSWLPELDPFTIDNNQGRVYPPSRTFALGLKVGI
ncbi:SusC/RagA family TonB-linked outer membrane protein [Pseudalgibacter alginicilyticus]|nr:TonB-dependent receptor [Pseudalgibacter alginicilyticus]